MNDFYCLEIEFPTINFSDYEINEKVTINKKHHAHIYTQKDDDLELRIYFEEETYFGDKLSSWAFKIDSSKFGSYIDAKLTCNERNKHLQKIDLSESKFLKIINNSGFYEDNKKYVSIIIDTAKFYFHPNLNKINTAEFYLDDKGYRVVKDFYTHLLPQEYKTDNNSFNFKRKTNSTMFYCLENSLFRPEFDFLSNDNQNNRTATIVKKPKIKFYYSDEITEQKANLYADIVLIIASFYYHLKIDYIFWVIYLPDSTIKVIKKEQKKFLDQKENLRDFGIHWSFNDFIKANWQEKTIENFDLLTKAITLFNQSLLVDSSSAFLIRYNIIEICDKQKKDSVNFTLAIGKKDKKNKQVKALEILLDTIISEDHEDFKTRWNNLIANLYQKSMKNQLVSFFESQGLDHNQFPITLRQLKELRNNITHGSIDKVDLDLLKRANILLYRINGILILNLMGIKNWKVNTETN